MSIQNTEARNRLWDTLGAGPQETPEQRLSRAKKDVIDATKDSLKFATIEIARKKLENDPATVCAITGADPEEYPSLSPADQAGLIRTACLKCKITGEMAEERGESPSRAILQATSSTEGAKEAMRGMKRTNDVTEFRENISKLREQELQDNPEFRRTNETRIVPKSMVWEKAGQIGHTAEIYTGNPSESPTIGARFNSLSKNVSPPMDRQDTGKRTNMEKNPIHSGERHAKKEEMAAKIAQEFAKKAGSSEEKRLAGRIAGKLWIDESGKMFLSESIDLGAWLVLSPTNAKKSLQLEGLWFKYNFAENSIDNIRIANDRATGILFFDKTGITALGSDMIHSMLKTVNEFNQTLKTNAGMHLSLEKPGGLTYSDKITILELMRQLKMIDRYEPGDLGLVLNTKENAVIRMSKQPYFQGLVFNEFTFRNSVEQLARENAQRANGTKMSEKVSLTA